MNLDDNVQKFLNEMETKGGKPLYTLSPQDARNVLINLQRGTHRHIDADIKEIELTNEDYGQFKVTIVRPPGKEEEVLPAIIYVHGGGWVLGNKETHDMLIRRLANGVNAAVFFVDYTLSPEAKYPSAISQIHQTVEYAKDNAVNLKIDHSKIAIAGDSAGGNLATAVSLWARKEHGAEIKFQALFYPVTNAKMDTPSYEEFQNGPWLTKKAMEWFWDSYLPKNQDREDIYVSPLLASVDELKELPQTLIITAENDVLRDEGEMFGQKLDEAGVDVLNIRINETIHDFLMLNALADSKPTNEAFAAIFNTFKKVFE